MFIRDAWYFGGFAHEIGAGPTERSIAGESLVLFRDAAGRVVALDNRCPHRFAPLAMGRVEGDRIQCAYHGLQFDRDGRCVHIPGQAQIPPGAGVRAYPAREQWGVVWLWLGGPERAASTPLLEDFGVLDAPGWRPVSGVLEVAAGYELLLDNLMDLTHIPFLHPNTLGNQGQAAAAEAETRVTVDGDTVSVARAVLDCEPAPLFAAVKKLAGRIDRHQYTRFVPPCYVLIDLEVMPAGTTDLERGLSWRVFHVVTPIDTERTRYHWAVARPFAIDDTSVSRALEAGIVATFEEDRAMLEAQARMLKGRSLDERTLYTRHDATPAHVRRIIARRIAAERAARAESAPAGATTAVG
jgi:phenylpropionate dioxygenase-like ring-hydroxylating dioxygenase large terminal subunit